MRDENYLIETFSFIYYSVSERCHLAKVEARPPLGGEIGPDDGIRRGKGGERKREKDKKSETSSSPRTLLHLSRNSRSINVIARARSCASSRTELGIFRKLVYDEVAYEREENLLASKQHGYFSMRAEYSVTSRSGKLKERDSDGTFVIVTTHRTIDEWKLCICFELRVQRERIEVRVNW